MNRRSFIKTTFCAFGALVLGVKEKAEELVTGVGRGSPFLFDNLGISQDALDEAYQEYAKALEKEARFIVAENASIRFESDGEWYDLPTGQS